MAPRRLYWLSQLESLILDVHSNNLFWFDFLTGTTLIIIPTDAFSRYKTATSAVVKETTGFLCLTSAQFSNLKWVYLSLPMAYVNISQLMGWTPWWTLNQDFHRTLQHLQIHSRRSAVLPQYINWQSWISEWWRSWFHQQIVFLERFYFVYDSGDEQVGLLQHLWQRLPRTDLWFVKGRYDCWKNTLTFAPSLAWRKTKLKLKMQVDYYIYQ